MLFRSGDSLAGPPSPSCSGSTIEKTRSPERFTASALEIKSWRERTPTCAEARPAACPCCSAPSRPIDGRLVIVGHGLVERQLLGPSGPGAPPHKAVLLVRRYRCRACSAVLVVGPRGLVVRRWYRGAAIALAFAAFARGDTSARVRALVSPSRFIGASSRERWMTLTRWIEAARRAELFAIRGLEALERRAIANHVVCVLAARAGWTLGADRTAAAVRGASIAA